jgi:dihydrofolate reductase
MISIIAAVAKNRAIGYKNKLIYWLPNDLKRFKALTTGHTIIMGRNTFLSLPNGALPNRRNIVLSKSWGKTSEQSNHTSQPSTLNSQFEVFSSLEEALTHCAPEEEIYIIGGASVYRQALKIADRLCLTEIDDIPEEADTFFPPYEDDWQEESREGHAVDDRHGFPYSFVDYIRKPATSTAET